MAFKMEKKLLYTLFIFSVYFYGNAQEKVYNSNTILSNISKDRPEDFMYLSAPDSTGYRRPLKIPLIHERQNKVENNLFELPYPILFIHGLNSDSLTWQVMVEWLEDEYGLSFGGRLDYCLDQDGNLANANTDFYNSEDDGADIARYETILNPFGDYFLLNFNVGTDGSFDPSITNNVNVLSNQAAIVKQGVAVGDAIEVILNETDKNKVILFGHSMGGLAAREYLQNPSIWQNDGQHHIAKLITSGSPHGGSNFGFGALSLLAGTDESSDAVRDLRSSYYWSDESGVYLFGGNEDSSTMWDSLFYSFKNLDVNCNGITQEYTAGLNQKNNPVDLDYSCIIGESDIVVSSQNSNLFNYIQDEINVVENLFYAPTGHIGLTNETMYNMQGLDEPNEYALSYEVELNKNYSGFVTQQPIGGYDYDYDDFKFIAEENGVYEIKISGSLFSDLNFDLFDSELNLLFSDSLTDEPNNDYITSILLNTGQYYLEFYATPDDTSPARKYNFSIETTLSNANSIENDLFSVYPNPTNSILNINSKIEYRQAEIYSVLGQKIFSKKLDLNQMIDLSELSPGFYNLILKNSDQIQSVKILKEE